MAQEGSGPEQTHDELLDNPLKLEDFKARALSNVNRLSGLLRVISDKKQHRDDKETAINLAVELFVGENAIVEVSNANRDAKPRRYPVRKYLTRLRDLTYDAVEITWADIAYVSRFRKNEDGDYNATVAIVQRFVGLVEGVPVYEDTTYKEVGIVLRRDLRDDGVNVTEEWDVLLSDISVTETK